MILFFYQYGFSRAEFASALDLGLDFLSLQNENPETDYSNLTLAIRNKERRSPIRNLGRDVKSELARVKWRAILLL